MLYLIHISRFLLIIIFAFSFLSKLRDFAAFEKSIQNFQLLPQSLHRPVALGFTFLESLIVILALLGESFLFISYGIAIVLLCVFIYALAWVLKRNIKTACNCFGTTEQEVSRYDIWRNLGIILIALLGLIALILRKAQSDQNLFELAFSLIIALVLSLFLLNLRELTELFV